MFLLVFSETTCQTPVWWHHDKQCCVFGKQFSLDVYNTETKATNYSVD